MSIVHIQTQMRATYVSVWDGASIEIRTPCDFDPLNRVVDNIQVVDIRGLKGLEREYVELPSGVEIPRHEFSIGINDR